MLEDLFKHFRVINEVNIGSKYREKFGDPLDYFGDFDLSLGGDEFTVKKEILSNRIQINSCSSIENILGLTSDDQLDFDPLDPLFLDPDILVLNSNSGYHKVVSNLVSDEVNQV